MRLTQTHTLTGRQEAGIRALEEACRRAEPFGHRLFLSNSLNTHPDMDCFFCAWEGETLAGVLTLFTPDPGRAEAAALVLPAFRRRGIFSALLAAALAELDRFGGGDILFCHEPVCKSGSAVLQTLPAELDHSEFMLEYHRGRLPPAPPAGLRLERAGRELLPALAAQSAAAFGEDGAESAAIAERFFANSCVTPYGAWLEGELAGQLYRNTEGGEVYFCGLCVERALQGRGVGRGMLCLALERALAETEGPIRLEVDSENLAAYRLYTSCGFQETAREDYYLMKRGEDDGGD